ncbi:uncharacterized protein LOC129600822 [Paramacrobiotus metropolitanus]|uniref:uncharacterized protein LOC129600822 n=1 Tax=Paramacrobiotus metropolitanus TaxID=2943436 RepID=UPI002445E324|nr:uncharacterized protein LOC129600822 [Paramacrobiotus metropolitanus]
MTFTGDTAVLADELVLANITETVMQKAAYDVIQRDLAGVIVTESAERKYMPTQLLELPRLIAEKALTNSLVDGCKELFAGMDKPSKSSWVKSIRNNLQRAIADYSTQSASDNLIPSAVQSIPWPTEIRSQIMAIQSRQPNSCLPEQNPSLIGHGFDVTRADPFAENFQAGIHLGDSLLHFRRCTASSRCNAVNQCTVMGPGLKISEKHVFTSADDHHSAVLESLDFKDVPNEKISINAGIRSVTSKRLKQFLTEEATISDEVTGYLVMQSRLSYHADDLLLDPRLISAACSLPDFYDAVEYTHFIRKFGTHIIEGVTYGNVTLNRTIAFRQPVNGTMLFAPETVVTAPALRPIKLHLRNISSYFTPLAVSQSLLSSRCQKFENTTFLEEFRNLLEDAVADYVTARNILARPAAPVTPTPLAVEEESHVLKKLDTVMDSCASGEHAAVELMTQSKALKRDFIRKQLSKATVHWQCRDADTLWAINTTVIGITIRDDSDQPLEQLAVAVNAYGEFSLTLPRSDNYHLIVEAVGYHPLVLRSPSALFARCLESGWRAELYGHRLPLTMPIKRRMMLLSSYDPVCTTTVASR